MVSWKRDVRLWYLWEMRGFLGLLVLPLLLVDAVVAVGGVNAGVASAAQLLLDLFFVFVFSMT